MGLKDPKIPHTAKKADAKNPIFGGKKIINYEKSPCGVGADS